jgi:hypothetical protein
MFKKDKIEQPAADDAKKKDDETAYEDSWYRSLKAMSERPAGSEDEEVGAPED